MEARAALVAGSWGLGARSKGPWMEAVLRAQRESHSRPIPLFHDPRQLSEQKGPSELFPPRRNDETNPKQLTS